MTRKEMYDRKRELVYQFEKEEFPALYCFDSYVKIGISEERCEIIFPAVAEEIRWLDEQGEL